MHLGSLRTIRAGSVAILENKELCFAESIDWSSIMKSQKHNKMLENNKPLDVCNSTGLVCSDQCSQQGCWAQGPNQCLSCAHYQLDETCVQSCDPNLGLVHSVNFIWTCSSLITSFT